MRLGGRYTCEVGGESYKVLRDAARVDAGEHVKTHTVSKR